jgi:hypothetical protein
VVTCKTCIRLATRQTAAAIIAAERGAWLFDPQFNGWDVKQ